MIQIYLIIGGTIGVIFAVGCIFLAFVDNKALNKIVNKNNQSALNHGTAILMALIINVLIWPVIVIFLGRLFWQKFNTH